jgi:hypothetical protein
LFCLGPLSHNISKTFRASQKVGKIGLLIFFIEAKNNFAAVTYGRLGYASIRRDGCLRAFFFVMEYEKGAGQIQTGLGEPQDHLVRGQHDHRRGDVRHGLVAIVIGLQTCTKIRGACMKISLKINTFVSLTNFTAETLSP